MPLRERLLLIKNNMDGENELICCTEHYRGEAAVFLFYDPEKGFLFEKRIDPEGALFGEMVIPGGKIRDLGERSFPLWAAQRECLEEVGVFPEKTVYLPVVFDGEQKYELHPFLMVGILWGGLENKEPEKKELVWMPLEEVFQIKEGLLIVNSIFKLETTRSILLSAKKAIDKYDFQR